MNHITKPSDISRPDFAAIAAWISPGAKVLDLGCGDGSLLHYLHDTRGIFGYGVEIDDNNVLHQSATFRPKGVLGRFYWLVTLPFHFIIFNGMIKNIAK